MRFTSTSAVSFVILAARLASAKMMGAMYTMTNDPSGNHILIHSIDEKGMVSYHGSEFAKGTGAHCLGENPPVADALLGQGSLRVVGSHIYHVNAGSGEVVMWAIDPKNPTKIRMVGKPESSFGDFPTSLAVSEKTGNVYVLNGGTMNGVMAMTASTKKGLKQLNNTWRSAGIMNQTNPGSGIPNSESALVFLEDQSKLVASIKGTPPTPGHLLVWDVKKDGSLSESTMIPSVMGGMFPLGMSIIPGTQALLVSDFNLGATPPSLGASIYDFSKNPVQSMPIPIPGAKTTCWAQYSEMTDSFFMTDFASGFIHEVEVDTANHMLSGMFVADHPLDMGANPTDLDVGTIDGQQYLFALNPSQTAVDVLALQPGGMSSVIQSYNFAPKVKSSIKVDPLNLQGMGVYIIQ